MVTVTRISKLLGLVLALTAASTARAQNYPHSCPGPAESPPNASPGFGHVDMMLSGNLFTLCELLQPHQCHDRDPHPLLHPSPRSRNGERGDEVFPGFIFGPTAGTYTHTFNIANGELFTPAFVTANGGTTASATAAFLAGMNSGEAYYNIHTTNFPGGEIRGFIVTSTPEPATFVLLGTRARNARSRQAAADGVTSIAPRERPARNGLAGLSGNFFATGQGVRTATRPVTRTQLTFPAASRTNSID